MSNLCESNYNTKNARDAKPDILPSGQNGTQTIPIEKLEAFHDHPFQVNDDDDMKKLVDSIRSVGLCEPILVRPVQNGMYEIISGHRRKHAYEIIGHTQIPAFVVEMDEDTAILHMVESNVYRSGMKPSEKAKAYRMKLEALKRKQEKPESDSMLSRDAVSRNESGRQVQRMVRLTYLLPNLLNLVDIGKISIGAGQELSFLPETAQETVFLAIQNTEQYPIASIAQEMRKLSDYNELTLQKAQELLGRKPDTLPKKIAIPVEKLRDLVPGYLSAKEISEYILAVLEKAVQGKDREE